MKPFKFPAVSLPKKTLRKESLLILFYLWKRNWKRHDLAITSGEHFGRTPSGSHDSCASGEFGASALRCRAGLLHSSLLHRLPWQRCQGANLPTFCQLSNPDRHARLEALWHRAWSCSLWKPVWEGHNSQLGCVALGKALRHPPPPLLLGTGPD